MPSGTLAVSPPIVNVTAPAGGTVSADVRLQSGIAQTVALQSQGLGQAGDGSFNYVATADDVNADSARSMVNVSPATISMQPGGEQKLTITVTVPQNVGDGIRYAMVRVTGTPGGVAAQQVGIAVELGVPVIVTISNTNLKKTGKLANLKVGTTDVGWHVVTGQIQNTGNAHFGGAPNPLHISAAVYDSGNHSVAGNRENFTGNSILPSYSRDFSVSLGKTLASGNYRVEVVAALQDGTVVDKTAMAFSVSNGQVLGATAVPYQGATTGTGSDGNGLLLGVLGGALGGAFLVAVFALVSRRRGRLHDSLAKSR
jgi:methionine-rich copper-binding protein CopC